MNPIDKIISQAKWQLQIEIAPMVVIDMIPDFADVAYMQFQKALRPFTDFVFEIKYDDRCLYHTRFQELSKDNIIVYLPDNPAVHTLEFRLSGKSNDHHCVFGTEQHNVSMCVQVNFWIENLPMETVMYTHGQYYDPEQKQLQSGCALMGNNGKQILTITTPIYSWLLNNSEHIMDDVTGLSN